MGYLRLTFIYYLINLLSVPLWNNGVTSYYPDFYLVIQHETEADQSGTILNRQDKRFTSAFNANDQTHLNSMSTLSYYYPNASTINIFMKQFDDSNDYTVQDNWMNDKTIAKLSLNNIYIPQGQEVHFLRSFDTVYDYNGNIIQDQMTYLNFTIRTSRVTNTLGYEIPYAPTQDDDYMSIP